MRGKAHSDETRAAVIAALLAGQGVNEVAQQYNLPPATVATWKAEVPSEQFEQVRIKKGEKIEGLIYAYLTTVLDTLRKQAEIVAQPAYVQKQSASDLATLHGVMADKAIRILEAAERANPGPAASGG